MSEEQASGQNNGLKAENSAQNLEPTAATPLVLTGENAPRAKRRVVRMIALSAAVIACLLLAAGGSLYFYIVHALSPVKAGGDSVRLAIPSGTGPAEIAAQLEQKGIIRSASLFTYYLRYKHEGSRFKAGVYELKPGMAVDDIIKMLNQGDTVKEETLWFTIPEGLTLQQIADRLSELHTVDPQAFIALADAPSEWSGKWSAQIPDTPVIRHRLEGYLFPETYEMPKGSSAHDILQRMMTELDRKLEELPPDWQSKLQEHKLTFHQMLTVASLIEREVAVEDERPIVASVIYNRLKKGMPLQIDATIQYLFDKPKERLYDKDLQIESPYNTYLHTGLPPGPIASPSLNSLKAALYPADTNYLFYVTRKDGSGGHLFAATFAEHQQNIAKSNKQSSTQNQQAATTK